MIESCGLIRNDWISLSFKDDVLPKIDAIRMPPKTALSISWSIKMLGIIADQFPTEESR